MVSYYQIPEVAVVIGFLRLKIEILDKKQNINIVRLVICTFYWVHIRSAGFQGDAKTNIKTKRNSFIIFMSYIFLTCHNNIY